MNGVATEDDRGVVSRERSEDDEQAASATVTARAAENAAPLPPQIGPMLVLPRERRREIGDRSPVI
jgi:hypothetical protein